MLKNISKNPNNGKVKVSNERKSLFLIPWGKEKKDKSHNKMWVKLSYLRSPRHCVMSHRLYTEKYRYRSYITSPMSLLTFGTRRNPFLLTL